MKNATIWIVVALAVLGASLATVWVLSRKGPNPASLASLVEGATPGTSVGQADSDAAAEAPHEVTAVGDPGDASAEATPGIGPSGQAQGEVQTTGSVEPAPVQEETTTTVAEVTAGELIKNGNKYQGKVVLVKGTIVTQCIRGCEFALDDGTGVISVQLEGKALDRLLSKGSVGKKVEARGVFHKAPRPRVAVERPEDWRFL